MKIAFIGLGNMGAPMARNLLKAGHQLNLFDLNQAVLNELAELGGSISTSPRAAASAKRLAWARKPTRGSEANNFIRLAVTVQSTSQLAGRIVTQA